MKIHSARPHSIGLHVIFSLSLAITLIGCGEKAKTQNDLSLRNNAGTVATIDAASAVVSEQTESPALQSITIGTINSPIAIGNSITLTASGKYSNKKTTDITSLVTWKSKNEQIVAISKDGTITGKNIGESSITAKLDGITSKAIVVIVAHTVGGHLSGLAIGNRITLTNNGTDNLTLTADGAFTFPAALLANSSYTLKISEHPNNQPCSFTYGTGRTQHTDVTNLNVICGFPFRGEMSATGSLITARRNHTATLLNSGKILVAGGTGTTGSLASAELYDPSTGLWSATSNMNTARRDHTATLLPNGKVLISGGIGEGVSRLASAEVYDPATGSWASTKSLSSARRGHTATLLPNGKVMVAGGIGATGLGTLSSVEIYDPETSQWSAAHNLTTARSQHTATLLPSGNVLIAGGIGVTGSLDSAEIFNVSTGQWSTTGHLASTRYLHTATLLPNNKVLVAGGLGTHGNLSSAELYDPSTNMWTSTDSLANMRYSHTAVLLPIGKVLVTGGTGATNSSALDSAELFDPLTGLWSKTGNLPSAHSQHTTILLSNGKALVAGGNNDVNIIGKAELYW